MRTQHSSADRFSAARASLVRRATLASGLAFASGLTLLTGCGDSSSTEFAGDLFIESCSLACTDGSGGAQVNCGVANVAENLELSVLFSQSIDGGSIDPSTLQVVDVANGTAPEGLRFVDPLDPRRVIFRPAIEFQSGGVAFSFERNRSYEIRIPGVSQGDSGPFISGTSGDNNSSRLVCTVFTSEGIADIVPGNPRVAVFVDVATAFDPSGFPIETERTQIGHSLSTAVTNVARTSKVYFEFNELMNIPTVADVTTGRSLTIFVELDTDGDIATAGADRIPILGLFEISVDQLALTTMATFTPDGQIPSAGANPLNPRLLIVRVTTAVSDIANLPVTSATGGGVLVAIPETLIFPSINLPDDDGENFDHPSGSVPTDLVTEDANVSGAPWGPDYLGVGLTGGSGRHGAVHVGPGETVVLNTDSQAFPMGGFAQIDVIGNGSGANYVSSLTVTDGVFELSSLIIDPIGRLVLEGSNPARLLVRGRCLIAPGGLLDVSGESASPHDGTTPRNIGVATPPAGGPQGAAGGLGGDRADLSGTNLTGVGAIANPGAVRAGQDGDGVGGTQIGSGLGGVEYPLLLPTETTVFENTTNDVGYNLGPDPLDPLVASRCMVQQLGASGSGGAYALPGGDGSSIPINMPQTENPLGFPISPGPTDGGDASSLMIEAPDTTGNNTNYDQRILRWQDDNLRGGSSGGGGGNHPFATSNNAGGVPNPTDPVACVAVGFSFPNIELWVDHSGASGGAGGGALEIVAGREIDLDGTIDASGGGGGNALSTTGQLGSFAMPGGGGSGGAVRLRGTFISVGPGARVDVAGGVGGNAPWAINLTANQTRGGVGSAGLFRIEDGNPDPVTQISFDSIRSITLPINPLDPLESYDWLSVAPNFLDGMSVDVQRPDTLSGVTSCWIKPPGNFLQINFREDAGATVAEQGWTMDVVLDDGLGGTMLRPFRGTSTQGIGWEEEFGNLIGYDLVMQSDASPIIVRFQGGRTRGDALSDPCDTDVNDLEEILPGSLTPWVSHPADLALVVDSAGASYTPNMIRYCILFDKTNNGVNDTPGVILQTQGVLGVNNLLIIADPD